MTKYNLIIFYFFLLVSCVSSSNFTKSELNYNAKIKIFDETNIIKSNISVFQNRIIIQFYEYIVGNLAKIELYDDGNIYIHSPTALKNKVWSSLDAHKFFTHEIENYEIDTEIDLKVVGCLLKDVKG